MKKINEKQLKRVINESLKKVLCERSFDSKGNFLQDEHNNDIIKDIIDTLTHIRDEIGKAYIHINSNDIQRVGNFIEPGSNMTDIRKVVNDMMKFQKELNYHIKNITTKYKNNF